VYANLVIPRPFLQKPLDAIRDLQASASWGKNHAFNIFDIQKSSSVTGYLFVPTSFSAG
jgi:hypothetical protein